MAPSLSRYGSGPARRGGLGFRPPRFRFPGGGGTARGGEEEERGTGQHLAPAGHRRLVRGEGALGNGELGKPGKTGMGNPLSSEMREAGSRECQEELGVRDPGVQDMGVREELGMGVLGSIGDEESGAPGTEVLEGTCREWGRWEDLFAEEREHRARGYREHGDLRPSGNDGHGGSGNGGAGNSLSYRDARRIGHGVTRSSGQRGN